MSRSPLAGWLRRNAPALCLLALVGWYLLATAPYLADFPAMEWAQMRIITPAYKLASTGTYGNDLLTGFYDAESRNYEYMPLYPLQVALAFALLGPGIWQARAVSVLGGLLTVVLTFALGRRLYGARLGLLAAAALVLLRLAVPVPGEVERIGLELNASGIPLLDLARVVRFDIWVPVWVLSACLCFFWAHERRSRLGFLLTGVLAGLATLTHVYGAFILVVLALVLLWLEGKRALRMPAPYLMAAGLALALAPWAVYVVGDFTAYRGQMAKHGGLGDLLRPGFYLDNLYREPWRYLSWIGGSFRHPELFPRLGIYLLSAGVAVALAVLWQRARAARSAGDTFLLIAGPVLAILLALLIHYKRYYYVLLVLPFLAMQFAYAVLLLWRQTRWPVRPVRVALAALLALAVAEGVYGVAVSWRMARSTTPYAALSAQLQQAIRPGARVLLAEPYWLALTAHPARSIQLAFLLSDPRYYAQPPSLSAVLLTLQPDYVVTEERLLDIYGRDPAETSANARDWRELDGYLRQHCPIAAADLTTPDYGEVKVYQCTTATP
jgi:4-amino-4-deoxy-L-arabinose transferase-like glycosyltransferase